MKTSKAQKVEKKVIFKQNRRHSAYYYSVVIILSFIVLFSLNLTKIPAIKNFTQNLKNTIQTFKPTEELFDDNGGVKLVSVLFPISSAEVNNQILNFKFKLDFYDNYSNDNGVISLYNPSGIIYATESGEVHITDLSDEITELKITHAFDTNTVYSGKFIMGVCEGQIVEKGTPLAVVISPKLEFFITNNDEIIHELILSQGELAWAE